MRKNFVVAAMALGMAAGSAFAAEPDGLTLPKGFHAQLVAEGLGSVRHLTVGDNGDVYVSTRHARNQTSVGIIALRLGSDHKATQTEHFSDIDQGTGIRFYKGALYAASNTAIYRFPLDGKSLVPTAAAETIVDGLPASGHSFAFDGKGKIYVSIDAGMNICIDPKAPKGEKPVGLKPCPALENKAGVWSFDASKTGQKFADGEHFATGIRNSSGVDYRAGDALYVAMHGRDASHEMFPSMITEADDNAIPDEMFRVEKSADLGWPYTYYDGVKKVRLMAPEYGGDGKTPVTDSKYVAPAAAFFEPRRPAVVDLAFYNGKQFPSMYRNGAFLAMHGASEGEGAAGQSGYDIVFVPFKGNKAGAPVIFADGFAGPTPADKNVKTAAYRPVGVAVGPDGALYVTESNKGRVWRISYGEKQ